MGASGAGKTTLLNILACRVDHKSEGKLYANNVEYYY
jgi:ABC-type lipoprotein export system ATPase subunit